MRRLLRIQINRIFWWFTPIRFFLQASQDFGMARISRVGGIDGVHSASLYHTPGQAFARVLAEAQLPHLSGFDLARRILEHDPKADFLFLYTQASFQGISEEEMSQRFTLLLASGNRGLRRCGPDQVRQTPTPPASEK